MPVVTAISSQQRNPDRVNVSVDGKYRFSLDVYQVSDLGIRVGRTYSEEELSELEQESQFGKLYARALEYTLMRPHSEKEIRDYLWRKLQPRRTKTGEILPALPKSLGERVLARLKEKGYVDDDAFARYWFENRAVTKGASRRKLTAELRAKGVSASVIDRHVSDSARDDRQELEKVIAKKAARYSDERKLIAYLMRQGFSYDDIRRALDSTAE